MRRVNVEQSSSDERILCDGGLAGQGLRIQRKLKQAFPAHAQFVNVCINVAVVRLLEKVMQYGRRVARLCGQIHNAIQDTKLFTTMQIH